MNKIIRIGVVLLMLFSTTACTSNNTDETNVEKQEIVLSNKNFFNVFEGQEGSGHSNVRFNEDNSFELLDYFYDGTVTFKGTYSIKDKVVELQVNEVGLGNYDKIVFNIINEDVLSLKTELFGSYANNIFVCCEKFDDLDKAIDSQRKNVKEIISGKTYYDMVDRYDNLDTSYITFNSDETFEMKEHYHEEFISISGKWEADEHNIKCIVEQCGAGDFKEINFYISDFERLFLETNLFSSQKDDIFTSQKVMFAPAEDAVFRGKFINASQKARSEFGASDIVLREDGTFALSEVAGMGAILVNGLFGREGDVLMFSNLDTPIYNANGEQVHNFEFRIIDNNVLELMRDLEGSKAGDCFSTDGNIPLSFTPLYVKEEVTCATYIHEPIADVLDEYLPRIELYSDGTFVVVENCYAGLGSYKGTYVEKGTSIILNVTDNSNMMGFAGQDVTEIVLDQSRSGYTLRTDLCMSCDGDSFILQ